MRSNEQFPLKRRLFLQAAVLAAIAPRAWAANPCSMPPKPEEKLPRGPFGSESTAEEVTRGLDLAGTTVLITGCNSGLGLESMRVLAMRGAHVIGTARTADKARRACDSVTGKATPVVLELSDFDSVRSCARTVSELGIPIDTLVCNAGIMALPELQLVNGIERQFVVNHLGHFLLVNELLEPVKRAPAGRIVMVSSCAHHFAPPTGIDFDNLDGAKAYKPWVAYGRSKLANGLFATELARRLADTGVTANALHPGVIKTNLGRHLENPSNDDGIYDKSIPQGAATQCYVATSPGVAAINGRYFADCNPAMASPLMYDEELAGRLWTVSEQLTG